MPSSGTLYVVATPIGNLADISRRAMEVLSAVDIIAAEDTRTSGNLLRQLGVTHRAKWVSHHKFNERARIEALLEALRQGQSVALLSDAGTPCISDPGYLLVRAAADEGLAVVGVPGPCAAVTALSVSGFPAEGFVFVGFLPRRPAEILPLLAPGQTLVFYESPKRIAATTALLAQHFPEAALCLCNDLSKKFEQIYRGAPAAVLAALQANPHAEKGEYTCVAVLPPKKSDAMDEAPLSLEALLVDAMVQTGGSLKEAIQALSAQHGKNALYAASLRLKELF